MDTNHDMDKPGHLLEQSTNYRSFKPKEKNFMTTKIKKGSLDGVLFSAPGYNSVGEPYNDPRGLKLRGADSNLRISVHGKEFRPGGLLKTKYASAFLNTPTDEKLKSNFFKTTGPRGFFTSPLKHGIGPGTLIQKQNYEHMVDEYDRKRDMAREEKRRHRALQLARPFSNVVKGRRTFGNDHDEYGEDRLNIGDKRPSTTYKGLLHEKPFKYSNPPKLGYEKCINKFPEYQNEGESTKSKGGNKTLQEILPWRPTYKRRSEPSESIAAHFKNKPKYSFM